jgi:DNA primase RepB-like protein
MNGSMHRLDLDCAAAFLAALTGNDGWTSPALFQTYNDRPAKIPRLSRVLVGSLRLHASALVRLNEAGACIAVAINELRGGRRLASEVAGVRALFIDCDAELGRTLALAPSISVQSKRGPHHYWLLHAGEPVSLFAVAQRQLAAFYGADPMVCDASRVMRLPGFFHCKEEPFLVQFTTADPLHRYSMREVLLPHEGIAASGPSTPPRCRRPAAPEAVRAFRRWAAAAPRYEGTRNVTAFVMAAEGLKTGIPPAVVEGEVRAYCDRAGIPAEAEAVLQSAKRRAGR